MGAALLVGFIVALISEAFFAPDLLDPSAGVKDLLRILITAVIAVIAGWRTYILSENARERKTKNLAAIGEGVNDFLIEARELPRRRQ